LKGKLNKHISNAIRLRQRQATVPADNVEATPCPFWSALRALEAVNVSMSIFEAKAGVRACTVPVTTDVCESLRSNMIIKQNIKKVKKFAMQTGNPWLTSACAPGELKGKALWKLLQKSLDMNCCTRHILPDEPWSTKLLAVEICNVDESTTRNVRVTGTHYACIEARVYLESDGYDTIAAIPFLKVPGNTWKEKRRNLSVLTGEGMTILIREAGGFIMKPQKNDVVLLPSGFVMMSASRTCVYARWVVSGDQEDARRVSSMLESLITEFTEIRNPASGHVAFLDYLKTNL
jgi:hypothetical protein